MKLKKIVIENVKSFKDKTEINLSDNLNVFVGPNGGGKSNFLDIVTITLRHFFIKFYILNRGQQGNQWFEDIQEENIFNQIDNFLSKYIGNENANSLIELTFVIASEDIDNIKYIRDFKDKLEKIYKSYRNKPLDNLNIVNSWNPELFYENKELTYTINNLNISGNNDPSGTTFLQYLNYFELIKIVGSKIPEFQLNPLLLHFSPYRFLNQQSLIANLSGTNLNDLARKYAGSTSKDLTTLIDLAIYYFGEKRRKFELEGGNYQEKFKKDHEVELVTKYLQKMGYDWGIECTDLYRNIYEIKLLKGVKKLSISQASSGEKEILNFLLGLFTLNVKKGLVMIDEPELHLHPKWQKILVELFQEFSEQYNNQFIVATHAPNFINEKTISSVIRIYRENEISKNVQPEIESLPSVKELLHLVNTFNNEKIYFADKVVLVEGLSDRIIFEKLIEKFHDFEGEIVEVLEVNGKHNLAKYRNFLDLFKIKNYIIADLDYVADIGESDIKNLFFVNFQRIDEKILKNKKSKDRMYLASELKEILENIHGIDQEKIEKLRSLWEHIETRNKKLKENLSEEEQKLLNTFIESKKSEDIYILKYGEIEDYFPKLENSRNLDSVVDFVTTEDFNHWFDNSMDEKRKELELIVREFLIIEKNNVQIENTSVERTVNE